MDLGPCFGGLVTVQTITHWENKRIWFGVHGVFSTIIAFCDLSFQVWFGKLAKGFPDIFSQRKLMNTKENDSIGNWNLKGNYQQE